RANLEVGTRGAAAGVVGAQTEGQASRDRRRIGRRRGNNRRARTERPGGRGDQRAGPGVAAVGGGAVVGFAMLAVGGLLTFIGAGEIKSGMQSVSEHALARLAHDVETIKDSAKR